MSKNNSFATGKKRHNPRKEEVNKMELKQLMYFSKSISINLWVRRILTLFFLLSLSIWIRDSGDYRGNFQNIAAEWFNANWSKIPYFIFMAVGSLSFVVYLLKEVREEVDQHIKLGDYFLIRFENELLKNSQFSRIKHIEEPDIVSAFFSNLKDSCHRWEKWLRKEITAGTVLIAFMGGLFYFPFIFVTPEHIFTPDWYLFFGIFLGGYYTFFSSFFELISSPYLILA